MSSPTIRDVAKQAGVSKSLVSLVLRNSPQVRADKRAAVLSAVQELGYRPNANARNLSSRRTNLIGVVASALRSPFMADVVDTIDGVGGGHGFDTILACGGSVARDRRAVEMLLELRTDGIILIASDLPASAIAQAAKSAPIVSAARALNTPSIDWVANDDARGSELAVNFLHSLGHRRIGFLGAHQKSRGGSRLQGYRRAMEQLGLGDEICVAQGGYDETGGAHAAREVLALTPRPTAVLAINDAAAIGALQAFEDHSIDVPGDMSVVGYDNTAMSAHPRISLTTINQDRVEIGTVAARMLMERISGERTERETVRLEPGLVVRGTTKAIRVTE